MQRSVTILVAALLFTIPIVVPREARAAGPFPEVPLTQPPPRSYLWAYAAAAGGATAIGVSFVFSGRGNRTYDEYLVESDPDEIERLWDRTILNDRLSSGLLLGGEVLLATAIYLAFLHEPAFDADPMSAAPEKPRTPFALSVGPGRCALAFRF